MYELILLIPILLFNAFAIIGVNRATEYESVNEELHGIVPDSKMILWKLRYYSIKTFGEFWSKPICTCCTCMASLHSIPFYLTFILLIGSINWLFFYPLYIVSLAGIVTYINSKIG